jgi:hypothetical protein
MNQNKEYVVWVRGVEVNDFLLSEDEAKELALKYKSQGYDDVIIENQKI